MRTLSHGRGNPGTEVGRSLTAASLRESWIYQLAEGELPSLAANRLLAPGESDWA